MDSLAVVCDESDGEVQGGHRSEATVVGVGRDANRAKKCLRVLQIAI